MRESKSFSHCVPKVAAATCGISFLTFASKTFLNNLLIQETNEEKLPKMEEERTDALEMAEEAYEEREAQKGQSIILNGECDV